MRFLLKNETAFKQELALLLLLAPLAFYLGDTLLESVLLVAVLVLVLIVEVINTAIEVAIDRIGEEYHALSGLAKDLGSTAVLISLFLAFFTWIAIGISKL